MMILSQLNFCSGISVGGGALKDQSICFSNSWRNKRKLVSIQSFNSWKGHYCVGKASGRLKSPVVVASSPFGRFSGKSDHSDNGRNWEDDDIHDEDYDDDDDDDEGYLEAIILVHETITHFHKLMYGFQEESPLLFQPKDPRSQVSHLEPGFLRQFLSPTIFLLISCDEDFLLPIVVGESAIESLIGSFYEDEGEACPNKFQLTWNIIERLGYQVKMVKITERVLNNYFARIFLQKPGEMNSFSVDARPSDAINIAMRCQAPILVNKQIVLADATRIIKRKKPTYDVILDSAIDGPDLISEELNMVMKMNLAVQEERYNDAAMWKENLLRIRNSDEEII